MIKFIWVIISLKSSRKKILNLINFLRIYNCVNKFYKYIFYSENINYFKYRTLIFFCGFITVVFSETTLKSIQGTLIGNIQLILIPVISFSILYLFTLNKLKKIQITS